MSPIFHKKLVAMRASAEARIRSDRKTIHGLASVYIQIIINSDRTTLPLNVSWPVEFFDNKQGVFLHRHRNDQQAIDYNMIVLKEKAKINDIFMFYRHSDFLLSVDQFRKEYNRYESRSDFYAWVLSTAQELFDEGKIELRTFKNAKSSVAFLKKFKEIIKFNELTGDLLESIESYARRNGCSINSAIGRISMVKNYAKKARKAGIAVNVESLNSYKMPKSTSRYTYLMPQEIEKLKAYYVGLEIPENQKSVLSQFLFSCCTGLRFSDACQVHWKMVENDMLSIIQFKGRKNQRVNNIPLIEEAIGYVHNVKGLMFNSMAEQPTNRLLKEIARSAGVRKNMTTHVARHTFATEFLRRGGHIEVLSKLLGHTKIETTMIYVHVDSQRLKDQMALFGMKS
jgi:site-specific recombinase XerD